MSKRDLVLGLILGVGIALCATGGAAWIMLPDRLDAARTRPARKNPDADRADGREPGGMMVLPGPTIESDDDLGRLLSMLERRIAALENGAPARPGRVPPEKGLVNRCFLLRNAFTNTGEFYEDLPVYRPTGDKYWERLGLNPALYPEIKRYRILWFGGAWSEWMTPGKDDFDSTTNFDGSSRLRWACFTDHEFQIEFIENKSERCFVRRNPFVETGRTIDGLPVYRPAGDGYWSQLEPDPDLHPEIKRYRILQQGGKPSEWFTPGKNDAEDRKPPDGSRRLKWCRFADSEFQVEFN